jgi:hypothetical protein
MPSTNITWQTIWYDGKPFIGLDDLIRICNYLGYSQAVSALQQMKSQVSRGEKFVVYDGEPVIKANAVPDLPKPETQPSETPRPSIKVKDDGYL